MRFPRVRRPKIAEGSIRYGGRTRSVISEKLGRTGSDRSYLAFGLFLFLFLLLLIIIVLVLVLVIFVHFYVFVLLIVVLALVIIFVHIVIVLSLVACTSARSCDLAFAFAG
jgi:hypothetical protein